MVRPKAALTAVDKMRRHPCIPLAREAVHPAHTKSRVATAKETLIATKTDVPKAPINKSVPRGMKDALTIGNPWLKIARMADHPGLTCVTV